ncbi:MAG: exodeoxyribonuclease VII large subunit [Gemmataceae bacterium]
MVIPPGEALTVSEAAQRLKALLSTEMAGLWVAGEITNWNVHASSGHAYFSLKDEKAKLECVYYRWDFLRNRHTFQNGMFVLAQGSFDFYAAGGRCQVMVKHLEPRGVGAAELALEKLKEELFRKGYFRPERKRPLPAYPRHIGIITSLTGAAIRDMLELLSQRWPLAQVTICGARVQGETSGAELASAVRQMARLHESGHPIDVLIVGRGGGSKEDLSAFNDASLAEAIFESPMPVISAVGHEIDVCIADRVADVRAETPSAAVVLATPDQHELRNQLDAVHSTMAEQLRRRHRQGAERLRLLLERPAFRQPLLNILERSQRLDPLAEELPRIMRRALERQGLRLQAATAALDTLSPLRILSRGYSLVTESETSRPITRMQQVLPGQTVRVRLSDGAFDATVQTIPPQEAPDARTR